MSAIMIPMDVGTAIGLVSLGLTFYIYVTKNTRKIERRLSTIEQKLEDRLDPIWNVIINELPKILIHPETPRRDYLLQKVLKGINTLTPKEGEELRGCLKKITENKKSNGGERVAALLLLPAVKEYLKNNK